MYRVADERHTEPFGYRVDVERSVGAAYTGGRYADGTLAETFGAHRPTGASGKRRFVDREVIKDHRATVLGGGPGGGARVGPAPTGSVKSMEYVTWTARPTLRHPVLVAAFAGWNDAAEAATTAVTFLRQAWAAHSFASIDSEEFFDFSSVRPNVVLRDGVTREITWPATDLSVALLPDAAHDIVLEQGIEPQLRWRSFCAQITDVAKNLDVEMVVTLGALLADVPHSRPVSIIGTATDPSLIARFGLQRSRYQGPTGIVGVLHDACTKAGLPTASLWAATPSYVAHARSPKAALALVERLCSLVGVQVLTTALEIATAGYEREVNELVASDEDTVAYVERLEAIADDGGGSFGAGEDDEKARTVDENSGGMLIEEVERFLREQGS